MTADRIAEAVGNGLEAFGIAVVLIGAIASTLAFVTSRTSPFSARYEKYRRNLGRAILLGLEFLVAADIIGTVAVEPSLKNVGILGGIVLIRTILSFALETEISGRPPWRREDSA